MFPKLSEVSLYKLQSTKSLIIIFSRVASLHLEVSRKSELTKYQIL